MLGQRIGDRHADLAGEMVVAGAAEAEIGIAPPGGAPGGGLRTLAGQRHQRFDGMRHLAGGEPIEAVAALRAGGEQVGLDHAGEMARRGLRGDACRMGEVRRSVGAAVHQQLQHGGPRRVAHQGGDFGQGIDGDHGVNLGPVARKRHGQ